MNHEPWVHFPRVFVNHTIPIPILFLCSGPGEVGRGENGKPPTVKHPSSTWKVKPGSLELPCFFSGKKKGPVSQPEIPRPLRISEEGPGPMVETVSE